VDELPPVDLLTINRPDVSSGKSASGQHQLSDILERLSAQAPGQWRHNSLIGAEAQAGTLP
jgi:hypothetical protein